MLFGVLQPCECGGRITTPVTLMSCMHGGMSEDLYLYHDHTNMHKANVSSLDQIASCGIT